MSWTIEAERERLLEFGRELKANSDDLRPMLVGFRQNARLPHLVVTAKEHEDQDKPVVYMMMAFAIRFWGAQRALLLNDAYFRQTEGTELPPVAPKEDPASTETLMVSQYQDNHVALVLQPYHHTPDGIVFDEPQEGPSGEMQGMMPEIIGKILAMSDEELGKLKASSPVNVDTNLELFKIMAEAGYVMLENLDGVTNIYVNEENAPPPDLFPGAGPPIGMN